MTSIDQQSDWGPCPRGELTGMVAQRQARRRRKSIDRIATVAAGAMACIAIAAFTLGVFSSDPPSGGRDGGLACAEVLKNLPTYVEGEMNDDLRQRMAVHLENCPKCKSRHDELIQTVAGITPLAGPLAIILPLLL
jgi:predicted anti-sigma-YlaC factor YlaD